MRYLLLVIALAFASCQTVRNHETGVLEMRVPVLVLPGVYAVFEVLEDEE